MGPFATQLQDKIIKIAEKEKLIMQNEDESSRFVNEIDTMRLPLQTSLFLMIMEKTFELSLCKF